MVADTQDTKAPPARGRRPSAATLFRMDVGTDDASMLDALDCRVGAILPEEYQDSYESVQPVSMGSAGLKFGSDGRVAWNEIWGTFCDLAMAGGPPHKGTFLEPASRAAVNAQPIRYAQVSEEICRGVSLVSGLAARRSPVPGWVRVACDSEVTAAWLLRAILMENVAARADGQALDLPAAPHFRLEKEIKNVVTVVAKTCHYWMGHVSRTQQRAIAGLFAASTAEWPFVEPSYSHELGRVESGQRLATRIADALARQTGLGASSRTCVGWLGLDLPSVHAAIWLMRGLVASNVLARREGTVLFVPVNPTIDSEGDVVVSGVVRIHRCAVLRGVL